MNGTELEKFITDYGRDIYSFCLYLTRNRSEADDLYQEAFLKAMEKSYLPSNGETMKSLLLSEAVRLWKGKKRKLVWRQRIREEKLFPRSVREEEQRTEDENPEAIWTEREKAAAVRRCVDRLPEKLRLVVVLYYMEERRIDEIADMLDIPSGTVKSRLHTAKKQLSGELSGLYEV